MRSIISYFSLFANSEPYTIFMYMFLLLFAIIFPVVDGILGKKGKNTKIWMLCSFIPLLVCFVHFLFNIYDGNFEYVFIRFYIVYIMAILFPLFNIFKVFKKLKVLYVLTSCILSVVIFFGTLNSSIIFLGHSSGLRNFSHQSYTQAYLSTIDCLKDIYVNSEWKEIDYDKINAEIYPLVEQAEKDNDAVEFFIALKRLVYLIPDGHVDIDTYDYDLYDEAFARLVGNDYGFIMFTLANGKTEAFDVDTESEAYKNGIKSGTIITSWDGVPINQAISKVRAYNYQWSNFPVAENEELIKPLILAGQGGDTVKVSFLDENNKEKTVEISKMGSYDSRLGRAVTHFQYIYFSDYTNIFADNFSTKMLSDEVGLLKITDEQFDDWLELKATLTGEFPEMIDFVTEKITALQKQGMKKLIIDLRNNAGGNIDISISVASLFTDSTRIANYYGGTKKWPLKYPNNLKGIGTFKDIPVTVLVNVGCVSAGDDMAKYLSYCDNVKLVGMTHSRNSSQAIGGICALPEGIQLRFPVVALLDENGDVETDTKADRLARIPLDMKIPIDEELAHGIFETDEDVELNYVLKHCMD